MLEVRRRVLQCFKLRARESHVVCVTWLSPSNRIKKVAGMLIVSGSYRTGKGSIILLTFCFEEFGEVVSFDIDENIVTVHQHPCPLQNMTIESPFERKKVARMGEMRFQVIKGEIWYPLISHSILFQKVFRHPILQNSLHCFSLLNSCPSLNVTLCFCFKDISS